MKDITTQENDLSHDLPPNKLRELYAAMLRIRVFNERQTELLRTGKIYGYVHLYSGQEAVAVGVAAALRPGDKVTSTHRAEGHFIAAGVPLGSIMAECLGRAAGLSGGRAGSMGLAAPDYGLVSGYEIVGGGIALATGIAWALKMQGLPNVVACYFGDGAANRGVLYESLNMAALWRLPVIYVCENNGYAVDTSIDRAFAVTDIASRATAFGVPGVRVDGTELRDVHRAASSARARAVSGEGPTFLEVVAHRFCGHHLADPQWYYRSREEVEMTKANCPIKKMREMLIGSAILGGDDEARLMDEITKEVEEAVRFAEASDWPDEASLFDNLFDPGAAG